jgi:hypothetical protein
MGVDLGADAAAGVAGISGAGVPVCALSVGAAGGVTGASVVASDCTSEARGEAAYEGALERKRNERSHVIMMAMKKVPPAPTAATRKSMAYKARYVRKDVRLCCLWSTHPSKPRNPTCRVSKTPRARVA